MMEAIKNHFNMKRMQSSLILLKALSYLPPILNDLISKRFVSNMEFCVSNTQGAREPIHFNDREVFDIHAWGPLPGESSVFIHVNSYNHTTKLHFTFDQNLKINQKDFVKNVVEMIDNEFANSKKS